MAKSKSLTTKKKKDLGGRPTKMTEEVTTKLESIFKIGGTIDEATSYAGISDETYRRWMNENESFMARMTAAHHYADVVAKNVVVDNIVKDKDVSSAKWWLEKREFKGSSTNFALQINNVLGRLEDQKKAYNLDE